MSKWQAVLSRRRFSRLFLTGRGAAQGCPGVLGEEGATIVEMAICSSVLFALLFGVIGLCMAFYSSNFVSYAARDATRWAIVRGSTSCSNTPNLTNCNATSAQIQTYVQNLGYPGITSANLHATTTWLTASATQPTTWSVCSTGTCNVPGNEVEIEVTYAVPIAVPFVSVNIINVGSTSEMVIAQ